MSDAEGADGQVCRICRVGDGRLHEPCRCAGSIAFAHQECLEQWIAVARKKGTCELCGFQFRFRNVYREGTPDKAPIRIIALQTFKTLLKATLFILRVFVCGMVWLGLVPWLCIWTLRFSFWLGRATATSYGLWVGLVSRWTTASPSNTIEPLLEANDTAIAIIMRNETQATISRTLHLQMKLRLKDHVLRIVRGLTNDPNLAKDTFLGQMIAISAVVLFFGIFLLHEWVMQHAQLIENEAERQAHAPQLIEVPGPAPPPAPWEAPAPMLGGPAQENQPVAWDLPLPAPQQPVRDPSEPSLLDQAPPQVDPVLPGRLHFDESDHNEPDGSREAGFEEVARHPTSALAHEPQPMRRSVDEFRTSGTPVNAPGSSVGSAHSSPLLPTRGSSVVDGADQTDVIQNMDAEDADETDGRDDMAVAADIEQFEADHPPDLDDVDDGDDADDGAAGMEGDDVFLLDDVDGLLTAIGLRGPFSGLFAGAGIILFLFLAISLALVAFPYIIGRLAVTTGILQFYATLPIALVRKVMEPLIGWVGVRTVPAKAPRPQGVSGSLAKIGTNLRSMVTDAMVAAKLCPAPPPPPPPHPVWATITAIQNKWLYHTTSFATRWNSLGTGDTLRDRIGCIVLGYVLALSTCVLVYQNPSTFGHRPRKHLRRAAMVAKAGLFGIIEIFFFPFLCGVAVSLVTLPLFAESSVWSRIAFFRRAPLSATYLTWAAGSLEMFIFAGWLSMCRDGLRPGAMFFIRDPQDLDTDPLHDFITMPSGQQIRKLLKSLTLYWTSIALGLGPAVFFVSRQGSVRWTPAAPASAVPYELLIVQFLLPILQRAFDFTQCERSLKKALEGIAKPLCLSSFLFDRRSPDEERRGGGGFALVPKVDNFKSEGEKPAVIRADAAGLPISEEGKRRYDVARDKYKLVFLPSWFKVRIAFALFALWAGSAYLLIMFPAALVFLGRTVLSHFGLVLHDTYGLLAGFGVLSALQLPPVLVKQVLAAVRLLPDLHVAQTRANAVRSLKRAFIWLRSAVLLGIVLPVILSLFIQTHIVIPFHLSKREMPTFALGYSWAFGVFYLSAAERIIHSFAPRSYWGTRLAIIYAANGFDRQQPQHNGAILLYKLILQPLLRRLLVALCVQGVTVAATWSFVGFKDFAELRWTAFCPALLNLAYLTWTSSTGWRKAMMQKSRDEAYLIERRLLDRDEP